LSPLSRSLFIRLPGGLIQVITARGMEVNERRLFRRKQENCMKKRLTKAKAPLPRFSSDEAAAEYSLRRIRWQASGINFLQVQQ